MSASEPPDEPNWIPDDTGAVPVGPEPEPTGAAGAGGAGGWGGAPRVEPFAIAALVWAIVSIVIPVIGTIVAFVLAARAADLIRRSRGEKSGTQYVTAARVVAGVVLALWIIGGIAFLALRDDSSNDNVAVPTQPPSTTIAPATTTTTTPPLTTTTVKPPVTTVITVPPPTITVIPPPPPPTTVAPPPTTAAPPPTTVVPTTAAPTTEPPTTEPPTTRPPPTTTPDAVKAEKVQAKLVKQVGASNRGVPADERFVVNYTPGQNLLVTWAINNGSVGTHPTGTPDCSTEPTEPPASTTSSTTSTTTTSTTTTLVHATTTAAVAGRTTQEQSRYEAKQILASIRPQLTSLKLDVPGVQLVGSYPLDGTADSTVVQVLYSKATVQSGIGDYKKAFLAPPAEVVQCLNPAFDLP